MELFKGNLRRHRFTGQRSWVTAALILVTLFATTGAEEFVINGDFESNRDEFVAWPGYVGHTDPDTGDVNPNVDDWFHTGGVGLNPIFGPGLAGNPNSITSWHGTGQLGINPVDDPSQENQQPFNDNGDNSSAIAFLQGESSIAQTITGLSTGSDYVLSVDYNARNCCGDFPIATLKLNGEPIPELDNKTIVPVLDANPWYTATIPLTADGPSLNLELSTRAQISGDATLIIDNLMLALETGGPNLVANGDFEANKAAFIAWPGYVSSAAAQNAPFRDNGNNATTTLFMQGAATIEQEISGLTPGTEYRLSLDYNARSCCGAVPYAELMLDDFVIDEFSDEVIDGIESVGDSNDWYHFETTLVADQSTLTMTLSSFALEGGDATFLVDNISLRTLSEACDINEDASCDATDIDAMSQLVTEGSKSLQDRVSLIESPLPSGFHTYIGDSTLDGVFDDQDIVAVFIEGQYLSAEPAGWAAGDWDGDLDFDDSDFVAAFIGGGYLQPTRQGKATLPEPTTWTLLLLPAVPIIRMRQGQQEIR
ncbi:MAG: hypothetical protein CMJ80_15400 [Planctomycetaceae bacterium]|nr:hypothetical protein [Planctomycetaceae bacterium]